VYSKDAASTRFWIVPERLGQIPIEVSAVSGAAGDAVRRLLLVEVSKSRAVCIVVLKAGLEKEFFLQK